jgi:hypothetical protein
MFQCLNVPVFRVFQKAKNASAYEISTCVQLEVQLEVQVVTVMSNFVPFTRHGKAV